MNTRGLSYRKIVGAGVVACIASIAVTMLVVVSYGVFLGVQARGEPDESRIEMFADTYTPIAGPIVAMLFTFLAAQWVARRVATQHVLHGALVGSVVALISVAHALYHTLAGDSTHAAALWSLVASVGMVAAGAFGARSVESRTNRLGDYV